MMNKGEEVIFILDKPKMQFRHRYRRWLQLIVVFVFLLYTGLFVYHSYYSSANNGIAQEVSIKEKLFLKKHVFERTLSQEPSVNVVYDIALSTELSSATATIRPPATTLDDVFISVKTTRNYHSSRLPIILKTWFQLAKKQTWFFTDTDDAEFQMKTNGHMINTNCSSSHSRKALCCKMSVEFDTFLNTNKKWFCHFDDDNYVNAPRLVRFLGDYNPREDWYLGKPSIQAPLEIISKNKKMQKKVKFWFATGGAGFCLSRALALKMMPLASDGKFISIGERIRLPDDVTMGYIIEHLLKKSLTVIDQFHSHLEPMKFIRRDLIEDQVFVVALFSVSSVQFLSDAKKKVRNEDKERRNPKEEDKNCEKGTMTNQLSMSSEYQYFGLRSQDIFPFRADDSDFSSTSPKLCKFTLPSHLIPCFPASTTRKSYDSPNSDEIKKSFLPKLNRVQGNSKEATESSSDAREREQYVYPC